MFRAKDSVQQYVRIVGLHQDDGMPFPSIQPFAHLAPAFWVSFLSKGDAEEDVTFIKLGGSEVASNIIDRPCHHIPPLGGTRAAR